MKKLLLTFLISHVSIFCMNEESSLTGSDEKRTQLEQAFIAFKPGLSEIVSNRQRENALKAATAVGMQKIAQDGALEEVYANIIGENFNLVTERMLAEQLDHQVNALWKRQAERIKREARAVFIKNGAIQLMEDTIKASLPDNTMISAEHTVMMAYAACDGVVENIIAAGPAALKGQINFMRKVDNVGKAKAIPHHTVQ